MRISIGGNPQCKALSKISNVVKGLMLLCAGAFLTALPETARAQLTADSPAQQIQFIIQTGDDDLRGDSEADAEIFSVNGQPLQKVTLKGQHDSSWGNDSTHTVEALLTQPLAANQIGQIGISLVQHKSITETDDNWNMQAITVKLVTSIGTFPLITNRTGLPLARLTGSMPTVNIAVTAGNINPKYQIYSLIYAVPGCTSSATYKCSTTGFVDYLNQGALSTEVSISSTFNGGLVVSDGGSGSQNTGSGGGLSGSATFTANSSGGSTVTIAATQGTDIKLAGNADGLNHDEDYFIILLNPLVSVHASMLQGSAGSTVIGWSPSYVPPRPEFVNLSVGQLKDPTTMNPQVRSQLQQLGFTSADYQEILKQDPLASSTPFMDPKRYSPTVYSWPYIPPAQGSQCNSGECACPNATQTISNNVQDKNIESDSTNLTVSAKIPLFKGINIAPSFTWTNSSSTSNTQSGTRTASAQIACPSPTYTSPLINVDLYWDSIYGSFAFVLSKLDDLISILSGSVATVKGQPQGGVPVQLKIGNKVFKTVTDNKGQYNFRIASATIAAKLGSAGQVSARGITQNVTLRSGSPVPLKIPPAKTSPSLRSKIAPSS